MEKERAKIIGISQHRLSTDGNGITTLVAFHECPLRCRHCLNPLSIGDDKCFRSYSPKELYTETRIDELYFLATNGGITFGGGEPCLRPQFIRKFRKLCGSDWQLNLETSLNVPTTNIKCMLPIVNTLIIDIKDVKLKCVIWSNNFMPEAFQGRPLLLQEYRQAPLLCQCRCLLSHKRTPIAPT